MGLSICYMCAKVHYSALSLCARQDINGVGTDVAVTIFVDRIFIAVTQLGTFGTLVREDVQIS
jgi:hypothetical protein